MSENKENYLLNDNMVLSSRIRLARNIDKAPFPNKIDNKNGRDIVYKIENEFYKEAIKDEFKTIYLWNLEKKEIDSLLEKHIISFNLINNIDKAAVIIDNSQENSIMINEEDHIRIQSITKGFNLEKAFHKANKIDNMIEKNIDLAFDEDLGYLTSCPTNIGTGLRASVMIHLPALSMNNRMSALLNAISQLGMTVRGIYGEGSKALGNIYQISNQITLGLDETEIINNLKAVINQIINEENMARQKFIDGYEYEIKDKIYRSLALLESAILLDNLECLNYISNVKLGIEMSIIKDVDENVINQLIIDTQPANLNRVYNKEMTEKESRYYRAMLVKERLKKQRFKEGD
ncbi:protein arginine kinase [Clostridium tepidum]|uniref:Protein-arginine kinase n=1 Tax=Clostridium tepidum TaxID=1962263 RepID=A0A1S9I1P2_9CLOT|nr:protein arginine kinase [Clostridium tepidum]MCR1935652.1 protein arginine kinase [Clostridium tepidum]MDU6879078.1 protein arginine kinase [Clostridium botulinum]OOO61325.1 protein arginine kinase [Clostridium tepidum]OOO64135.1 protein arginine kinase [Clostridium tepidum]